MRTNLALGSIVLRSTGSGITTPVRTADGPGSGATVGAEEIDGAEYSLRGTTTVPRPVVSIVVRPVVVVVRVEVVGTTVRVLGLLERSGWTKRTAGVWVRVMRVTPLRDGEVVERLDVIPP
ncbi:MAG: hypothetical protein ACYSWX_10260 [Planctomycetota bacterium]